METAQNNYWHSRRKRFVWGLVLVFSSFILSISLAIAALIVTLDTKKEEGRWITTAKINVQNLVKDSFLTSLTGAKLQKFYEKLGVGFDNTNGTKRFTIGKDKQTIHLAKSGELTNEFVKTFRKEPRIFTNQHLLTSGKGLKIGYQIDLKRLQKTGQELQKIGFPEEISIGSPLGLIVYRNSKASDANQPWKITLLNEVEKIGIKPVNELPQLLPSLINQDNKADYQVFWNDVSADSYYAFVLNTRTGDLYFSGRKTLSESPIQLEADLKYLSPTPITE